MLPSLANLPSATPAPVGVRTRLDDYRERRGDLVNDSDGLDIMLSALVNPPFPFPELAQALKLCGSSATLRRQCFELRWRPLSVAMGWGVPSGPAQAIAMIMLYHSLWLYTAAMPLESFTIWLQLSRPLHLDSPLLFIYFAVPTRTSLFDGVKVKAPEIQQLEHENHKLRRPVQTVEDGVLRLLGLQLTATSFIGEWSPYVVSGSRGVRVLETWNVPESLLGVAHVKSSPAEILAYLGPPPPGGGGGHAFAGPAAPFGGGGGGGGHAFAGPPPPPPPGPFGGGGGNPFGGGGNPFGGGGVGNPFGGYIPSIYKYTFTHAMLERQRDDAERAQRIQELG